MVDTRPHSGSSRDYSKLSDFRDGLYCCFGNGKDALMNLVDSLLTGSGARSFAELSLSTAFTRKWSSIYEIFDDAEIDRQALQRLFLMAIPARSPGARLILAADATPIVRAESPTARDRTYVHVPNVPKGAKPGLLSWITGVSRAGRRPRRSLPSSLSKWRLSCQRTL